MDKMKQQIENALTELNALTDARYAEAKATGKGFKALEALGQVGRNLQSALKNLDKAAGKPATAAAE